MSDTWRCNRCGSELKAAFCPACDAVIPKTDLAVLRDDVNNCWTHLEQLCEIESREEWQERHPKPLAAAVFAVLSKRDTKAEAKVRRFRRALRQILREAHSGTELEIERIASEALADDEQEGKKS